MRRNDKNNNNNNNNDDNFLPFYQLYMHPVVLNPCPYSLWTVLKEARVSFELELIDNIKNKKRKMTSYATIYYI